LKLQSEDVGVFYLNVEADDGVMAVEGADVGAGFPADGGVEVVGSFPRCDG
jgi:hypothetical protein